jgi:hypothetical protein
VDILTPRGQETLKDERSAAQIWEANFPHLRYIETPKDQPAVVDAVIVRDSTVVYVAETKCRYDMTLEQLFNERGGEWLVTFEKLESARNIAKGLGVPLIGLLYLVQDRKLLANVITDEDGNYVCQIRIEQTETQKTVNGGKAFRTNGFLQMRNSKILF